MRADTISFHLNGQLQQVTGLPGTTTLLRYLRDQLRLTGTKEGCAEGDCGACSVALLERRPDGSAAWRSVDACLLFLPMLHGKQVFTVEGLREAGPATRPTAEGCHPVQRAVVDLRASQCGYCTPGVVMSLFEACYRDDLAADDPQAIDEQLAGNLCRCTGYRPIREAAQAVAGLRPPDRFLQVLQAGAAPASALSYCSPDQLYLQPADLQALWMARDRHPGARLVAGGTDVGLEVTQQQRHFPVLIGLEAIDALRDFDASPQGWTLGAGLSMTQLQELIGDDLPALSKMLSFFGARQIRNRGTLGGNLCTASPVGDLAPVMMALGATAVAAGPRGERRIPMAEFFPAYRRSALRGDEILLRVFVPRPPPEVFATSYKVSKRRELDISAVSAGMYLALDAQGRVARLRLAYGGVAATPVRALHTEQVLLGRPWDPAEVRRASQALSQDFTPISDLRGSARYRRLLARNLLLGFALESARGDRAQLPVRPNATVRP